MGGEMKKLLVIVVVIAVLVLGLAAMVGAKAEKGTAYDADALWLGEITWLSNNSGGHFWFTPAESEAYYTAGHRYHNIYKLSVDDPSEWCYWHTSADRIPYTYLYPADTPHYFKIWDVTTGELVSPPDCP
jgi:hypothetical protein